MFEHYGKNFADYIAWYRAHRRSMAGETAAMDFLSVREWRGNIDRRPGSSALRDEFRSRFSFAIPDARTIAIVAQFGPLLEVGSGNGYWAWELRKAGVDVVATDLQGAGRYWRSGPWSSWTSVEQMDPAEAIRTYPTRSLLMVWPDSGREWPAEALRAYRGDRVLYVGEAPGGRTGNYDFHSVLLADFACESVFQIPRFYRQQDQLWVWKRSAAPGTAQLATAPGYASAQAETSPAPASTRS